MLGCTAFDADPSGRYAILGLTQRADGTYVASAFLLFFIGDPPAGPDYERALERLGWAGPMDLPPPEKRIASGDTPSEMRDRTRSSWFAVAGIGGALTAGVALLARFARK